MTHWPKARACLLIAVLFVLIGGGGSPPALAVGGDVARQDKGLIPPDQPASSASAVSATISPTVYRWTKTWGGPFNFDGANQVAVDGAGNVYVVGNFSGTVDFDPDPLQDDFHTSNKGTIDAFLTKFDPAGVFLWARTWGGAPAGTPNGNFDGRDVAYGVDVDSAGNVYVVGAFRYTVDFDPDPDLADEHTSNADSENNIYFSKFAPDGTLRWVRTWGPALVPGRTSFGAEAYHVAVAGNHVYVAGDFSGDQTDFDPWGSHDWHTNHFPASGTIWFDSFLSKFDLNGSWVWSKTWGGEGYDDGPGVAVDRAGHVYVAGMYASQNINFDPAGGAGGAGHPAQDSGILVDVFLTKFDANGTFQWVRTWGGQGTEDAMGSVVVDGANNVYVAGRFASVNCDFDPGGPVDLHSTHAPLDPSKPENALDGFLSSFSADGTFRWAKTWGGNGQDQAEGLAADGTGHLYVAGVFSRAVDLDPNGGVENRTSNGLKDAFISRFDSAGNLAWAQTWGGSGDDRSNVTVDELGTVYAPGWFQDTVDFDPGGGLDNHAAAGGSDASLAKYAPSLHLWGVPGDAKIYLTWTLNVTVPLASAWQIDYTNGLGSSGVVADVAGSRASTLTGLTNGTWYTVTLNALLNAAPILTDTVRVRPDRFVYLPLMQK